MSGAMPVLIVSMHRPDEQEIRIAKALIRNPRLSDNRLGEENAIPVRTVSRKRARLEQHGTLRYFAEVDMTAAGTGYFACRHMYIIRFSLGVTERALMDEVANEPHVITDFTRTIYESYVAEIDGHVALLMVVEGVSDSDVLARVQEQIIPALRRRHGPDAIDDVQTVRLLSKVRKLRNYLPSVNMEGGMMKADWSPEAIFVA